MKRLYKIGSFLFEETYSEEIEHIVKVGNSKFDYESLNKQLVGQIKDSPNDFDILSIAINYGIASLEDRPFEVIEGIVFIPNIKKYSLSSFNCSNNIAKNICNISGKKCHNLAIVLKQYNFSRTGIYLKLGNVECIKRKNYSFIIIERELTSQNVKNLTYVQ